MRWPGWRASCAPAYQYANNQDCKNLLYGKHFNRKSTAMWCAFRFGTERRFGSATLSTLTKDLQRFQDPHHLPQHFQCPILISSTEIGHHGTSVFTTCGPLWHSWIILNRLTQHCQYNPLNFSAKCKILLAPLETRQLSFSALLECRVQVKVYADPLRCDQSWRRPLQPLPPGKSSGPMATLITRAKPLSADKTSNLVTQKIQHSELSLGFCECAGSVEH